MVGNLEPATADFLARLVRLNPDALVRLRDGEIWGLVPWKVLVARTGVVSVGILTVRASAWLDQGGDPALLERQDVRWRNRVPVEPPTVRETMPTGVVRRLGQAAEETLRTTAEHGIHGRAVGSRKLRDALLDHVPIVVTTDEGEWRVPQRLVQAVLRAGLLVDDDESEVRVVSSGEWTGLDTDAGFAWWHPTAFPPTLRR